MSRQWTRPRTPRRPSAERRGFTLLELIVVLTVLGVMTAVVEVTLRPFRQPSPTVETSWRQRVAGARRRALATGHVVHSLPGDDPAFTAWPDGRVLSVDSAGIDPLTGLPAMRGPTSDKPPTHAEP